MSIVKYFINKHINLIIISVVYLTLIILMLPLRNAAYLDDFAYIKNVGEFVTAGNLRITDWASTTLVFPVLWGALFAKIFGFSIKILHVSNIVLFYFGLLAFHGILRSFNIDRFKSVIFTLFLLSYPWIFQFLFSFMSDTFYVSLMLISVYFYIRGIQNRQFINLFFGSIFASLAFLTRQIGITLPITILLILLIQSKIQNKLLWKELFSSVALPILTILGYYQWMAIVGPPAAGYIFFNEYTQKSILAKFLPLNLQRFGDTNRLYWDLFLQRPSIYFVSITNHFFPFFLLFIFSFSRFKKFIATHSKTTLFVIILFLFYIFLIKIIWGDGSLHRVPYLFTGADKLIGSWDTIWPKIFFLGFPFWIIVATLSWVKTKTFFVKRKRFFISKKFWGWGLLYLTSFIFYKAVEDIFSVDLRPESYGNDLLKKFSLLRIFYVLFFKPYVWMETFREIWLFILVILVIAIVVYVLFIKFKIKFRSFNFSVLFITLVFLGNFAIINFLAHSHWEEYTIAFAPLLILLIGFLLKDFYIPKIWGVILISLLFLFSLQITRNRYQEGGAMWELGTQIVNRGVHPAHVGVINLAWHRYWLWEDAFNEMVNTKYGGNKYLVNPSGFDPLDKSVPKEDPYYNVSSMPANEKPVLNTKDYILSEPYWIITRDPLISFRKAIIWKVR